MSRFPAGGGVVGFAPPRTVQDGIAASATGREATISLDFSVTY